MVYKKIKITYKKVSHKIFVALMNPSNLVRARNISHVN